MSATLFLLQLGLALAFVVAATGKVLRSDDFSAALKLTHLPSRVLIVVVPAVELSLALALLISSAAALVGAFLAASVVLAAFTVWVGWVLKTKRAIRCGCFGATTHQVDRGALARNLVLKVAESFGASVLEDGQESNIGSLDGERRGVAT